MSIYGTIKGKRKTKKFIETNRNLISQLMQEYITWARDENEALWCLNNDVWNKPKCKMCSSLPQFRSYGYHLYCSKWCRSNDDELKAKAWTEEARNKRKETSIKKYGTEHPFQSDVVKKKYNETCLDRYGKEYYMHTESFNESRKEELNRREKDPDYKYYIMEKGRDTFEEKTGYRYAFQHKESLEKQRSTMISRYGTDVVFKIAPIKEKIESTNLKKYGYKNASKNEQIKDKRKSTCMLNYGVEYPMHNPESFYKMVNSCFKRKQHISKKGNEYFVQGYEGVLLDKLENSHLPKNIIYNKGEVPHIEYYDEDNKKHIYYPDVYTTKDNTIHEVKSPYTFSLCIDKMKNVYDYIGNYSLKIHVCSDSDVLFTIHNKEQLIEFSNK